MKYIARAAMAAGISVMCAGLMATGSHAGEVFAGVYKHDMSFVRDIFGAASKNYETGEDLELGWRSDRIESWGWLKHPSIYVMTQLNDNKMTNQADIGLTWKNRLFHSQKFYIRPAVGLALHDGRLSIPDPNEPGISQADHDHRVAMGLDNRNEYSLRVLFNPQLGVGYDINDRAAVEIAWVHMSHGGLGHDMNQGQDNLGVRFNYRY